MRGVHMYEHQLFEARASVVIGHCPALLDTDPARILFQGCAGGNKLGATAVYDTRGLGPVIE